MSMWDVIVVGGGVMGTAAARSAATAGRSCLLLERFRVGHDRGSSHGPTRIFRLAYHHPVYVRLARAALAEWRHLEDAAGEGLLITTGGLDAGPGAPKAAQALEAAGETFSWMSADQVAERWPGLRLHGAEPVLFQAEAGVCLADRVVAAQLRLARAAGATVMEERPAIRLIPRSDDDVEVTTEAASYRARSVIVTSGAWASDLLAPIDVALPLRVTREQVSYFATEPALASLPTLIEWGTPARYAVPDPTRPGAFKAAEHMTGPQIDPFRMEERRVDPATTERVARWTASRVDGARGTGVEACLYTTTPDEDFVLDRVGPVVVGSACSGHGFKFAPLLGRILAKLAFREDAGVDMAMFAAGRRALAVAHG